MKIALASITTLLLTTCVNGFAPQQLSKATPSLTQQYMFGGAGAGMPSDPEQKQQMEAAAKSMGMSVEEYSLGMRARERLVAELDKARVYAGDKAKVAVERDGNNPPKYLEITITDDGKDMGKEQLSSALCAALKKASDDSRKTRQEAQKGMMTFINEEMKKMGKA